MKVLAIASLCMLVLVILNFRALGQDQDGALSTRINATDVPQEGFQSTCVSRPAPPDELETALKAALETGNKTEVRRLEGLLEPYRETPVMTNSPDPDLPVNTSAMGLFKTMWNPSNVEVYTGSVNLDGPRQIDLKQGEDGNLYLAVNKIVPTNYQGWADVYKSTDGGLTWSFVNAIASQSAYFGEISMVVDVRSDSDLDSTRIVLFYTRSINVDMAGATLRCASFLRDGTGFMGGASEIRTPVTGCKMGSPSGYSDGAYSGLGTYLGVVAAEYSNNGDTSRAIRIFRSTDWGLTWDGRILVSTNQDFYPTAAFKPGHSIADDSVYVAVERRLGPANSLVRIAATKFTSTGTDYIMYYLPDKDTASVYEKPFINIRQTGREYGTRREVIVTTRKNGRGVYHYNKSDGAGWRLDGVLAGTSRISHTFCASDSLTANGGYFIATWTDSTGDSIGVRRGVLGNLGDRIYNKDQRVSPSVLPACAIYKQGSDKYIACAFVGYGPENVYFNNEALNAVSVERTPDEPSGFALQQNYPNPFNPRTVISSQLSVVSNVKLAIYDVLGREVMVLVNERRAAGAYEDTFDASGLASGVYIYRLTAGSFVAARKMVLMK